VKINLVLPGAGNSGGVKVAFMYLNYLSKNGHDVICYVPSSGAYYGWKRILFLKSIYRIAKSDDLQGKWFNKKFNLKFVPLISNNSVRNADITIATSWLTSYWVEKLNKNKGKKAYFIQDYETWGSDKQNMLVRKSYKLPFDLKISVSKQLKIKLERSDNCSSLVVVNGIQSKYIRNDLKLLKKKNLIIGMPYRSAGRGKDIKNCKMGLKVLQKIKDSRQNLILKTFGFKKPKLWEDNIDFLENPSRSDLIKWYDTVDIFYVPSLYEGWGLPAMEAMARGCAVVAGNNGCIYEFGKDRINCLVLKDPSNEYETFNCIKLAVDNAVLRNKLRVNAIKTIKNYTFEESASKFEEVLNGIL
jgi:glycosyltransferase involved in cell wall biosynthesis